MNLVLWIGSVLLVVVAVAGFIADRNEKDDVLNR